MSESNYNYYVLALNPNAEEALSTLLNEINESAEHSRCNIKVGKKQRSVNDVYLIPGHHVWTRVKHAGRQREYVVFRQKKGEDDIRVFYGLHDTKKPLQQKQSVKDIEKQIGQLGR